MTSDQRWHRWRGDDSSAAPTENAHRKSKGVNPSSFHKTLPNSKQLKYSERKLVNILQVAAHNEVVQKRLDHTQTQKMRRSAYHRVTSLKIFPLQDLAMDFLFSLLEEYLGDSKLTSYPERSLKYEKIVDRTKPSQSSPCENDIQGTPSTTCKRRKLGKHSDGFKSVIDDYTAEFLAKNRQMNGTNRGKCCFLPELWSMEPRIFALEISSGKRRYIVGQMGRFLQQYWREMDPRSRHHYEVIREGTPCRLYFDLEFCKRANPHISLDESEVLMTEFIEELCSEFLSIHDIHIHRSCIVDLDSSTDKKFSRHLIVHLPNGKLFADAHSAGAFAKRFVGRLAEEISTGVLSARRAILAKHLFVNNQAPKTKVSRSFDSNEATENVASSYPENSTNNGKSTCFVDLGVYTRNRLFRLMGSMKFGKGASAALRIAAANEFQFPTGFDNKSLGLGLEPTSIDQTPAGATSYCNPDKGAYSEDPTCDRQSQSSSTMQDHNSFCSSLDWEMHARALAMTLVVPANASKTKTHIIGGPTDGQAPTKVSVTTVGRCRKPSSRNRNGESSIPKLDKFILELSKRGGVQGKIRAWSMECVSDKGKAESHYMFYQMSDNRWCENIGRAHRSNNIIWNIDLTLQTYWQTCHDPDCRAANFRGCAYQLPEEVATEVRDYLLDQEIAELDEDRIVQEAMNQENFSDAELDEALGDIDMALFTPKRSDAH